MGDKLPAFASGYGAVCAGEVEMVGFEIQVGPDAYGEVGGADGDMSELERVRACEYYYVDGNRVI